MMMIIIIVFSPRILINLLDDSHLDPKEETTYEGKVDTWSAVYKKLTGKDVSFLFPH